MKILYIIVLITLLSGCSQKQNGEQIKSQVSALDLTRGDIALCTSGRDEFGKVRLTSRLHSLRQRKISTLLPRCCTRLNIARPKKCMPASMEKDPQCIMAYWGAAM